MQLNAKYASLGSMAHALTLNANTYCSRYGARAGTYRKRASLSGTVHALCVLIRSEKPYFIVNAAIRLHALE